ncbi:MAG: hypothetical protein D6780_02910 [Candidatus Dadabacteria bacterium]|nr:MAG: hypothetical protein D6780_02910 [Candidatus Dadabacteria bacterium]
MKKLKVALKILILAFLLNTSACSPRGETISLDEVFKTAQTKYLLALKKAKQGQRLALNAEKKITKLTSALKGFVTASDTKMIALQSKTIAKILGEIANSAGYTSRPAFGELQKQYQKIFTSAHSGFKVPLRTRKLLSARTYSLLYRELKTTAFKLKL